MSFKTYKIYKNKLEIMRSNLTFTPKYKALSMKSTKATNKMII